MILPRHTIFFALAAIGCPAATQAQMPMAGGEPAATACTAPGVLPPAVADWATPHRPIVAARKVSGLGKAVLTLGMPVAATLPHTPEVTYAVPPAKPGGSVSYGGLFAFTVTEPGTYRVGLDAHSWTDVIETGVALPSIAHGHGPVCTSLAKMVDYALKPGRHLLQISAQGDPKLALMVVKLP